MAASLLSAVEISGVGVTDANTGSTSITVPASCTGIAVFAGGFFAAASQWSGGSVSLSTDGALTAYGTGADASGSLHQGASFFKEGNLTAGTQTLSWDWAGTAAPSDGALMVVAFIGGSATTSAIRDSDGLQSATLDDGATHSTKTLTAASGDLILCFAEKFWAGAAGTATWTNANAVATYDLASGFRTTCAYLSQASPSGNQTVGLRLSDLSSNDGSMSALVVKQSSSAPAAGVQGLHPLLPTLHRFSGLRFPGLGFPVPVSVTTGPQVFAQEMDATAVAVTASIQKQVNKTLSATAVGVTASLATAKVKLQALTATAVVVTASIQKQVNKTLSATAIAVTGSIQKQVNKILTATAIVVTASLQSLKVILKVLTATAIAVTGSIQKQVNKPLTATTIAVTGTLQKQVNKTLRATTVAVTASLQSLKVILKVLTATTVAVTASMVRQAQLHLTASSGVSASIQKLVTKTLSASSVVTATLDALKGGIVVYLTGAFDAVRHRLTSSTPHDQEWTSDPDGKMGSSPHESEFD